MGADLKHTTKKSLYFNLLGFLYYVVSIIIIIIIIQCIERQGQKGRPNDKIWIMAVRQHIWIMCIAHMNDEVRIQAIWL